MQDSVKLRASVALAAHAETFIEASRVVVFGDATSPLIEALLERGARLIHVVDPEPTRVAEAAARNTSRNVSFAPLGDGGLALREASFEVGVIEDLSSLPEAEGALRRMAKLLGPRGIALVATANDETTNRLLPAASERTDGDGLDYYQLYDLVSEAFAHVRMLGQTPFVGYAVVDFAPSGELEPVFDTGFVPGGAEEPETFVAIGSHAPANIEPYVVVQLPLRETVAAASPRAHERELSEARAAARELRDRLTRLEAEPRSPKADPAPLVELETQLRKRDQWITQLEGQAAAADERADAAQDELDRLETERDRLTQERDTLTQARDEAIRARDEAARARDEAARARDEATRARDELAQAKARLETELSSLKATLGGHERAIAEARRELDQAARVATEAADRARSQAESQAAADVGALERQLLERGAEVHRLERCLAEAARAGTELLREVEALRGSTRVSELEQELETLRVDRARDEAALTALRWEVAARESALETNPALTAARAQLQEQATLLEQYRAALRARPEVAVSPPSSPER